MPDAKAGMERRDQFWVGDFSELRSPPTSGNGAYMVKAGLRQGHLHVSDGFLGVSRRCARAGRLARCLCHQ